MGKYRFQMYAPDRKRQISLLQKKLYRSFAWRHAAYMEWKHLRNPYWNEPLIYLALCEDRVVGIRAMFGTCWEAGDDGRRIILPCASDAAIDPGHRNSGLFEELTEFAMEDLCAREFSHVLNLSPTSSNYVVSVMTMGWRPMGSSDQMFYRGPDSGSTPSGEADFFRRRLRGVQNLPLYTKTEQRVKKAFRRHAFIRMDNHTRTKETAPVYISEHPDIEGMERIVGHDAKDGRLRHVRDRTYFSWRFGNPRFNYRFLYWGEREPEGYMVLQSRPGEREVRIVDWEGRTPAIQADLLEAALSRGRFSSVHVWACALSGPIVQILRDRGFIRAGEGVNSPDRYQGRFLVKPLMKEEASNRLLGLHPEDRENWNLRMIYSDGT